MSKIEDVTDCAAFFVSLQCQHVMKMSSIQDIIEALASVYPPNEARAIALALCEHIAGLSRARLLSDTVLELCDKQRQEIDAAINRLKKQEPLQYVLGEAEFYGLTFKIDKRVLIPRPETEELVEWIVNDRKNSRCAVLDLCTGSGCIAIALAKNLPEASVSGCDISEDALQVARENSALLDAGVDFLTTDVLSEYEAGRLPEADIIVSNPPYVMESEKTSMQTNVIDFEPFIALFVPDADPLLFYKAIGKIALAKLTKEGALYVEINREKGEETISLFRQIGFGTVELRNDLFGNARMVKAIKN